MLISRGQAADMLRGRPPGVSSYLTKPCDPRDIVRLIEARLYPLFGGVGAAQIEIRTVGEAMLGARLNLVLICPDRKWRRRARRGFRKRGHAVHAHADVGSALVEMGEKQPDRIILLPFCDESAESARERLKTHPPTCHIQVLMPRDEESFLRLVNTLGRVTAPVP